MELCTPTGAALLATLATGWGPVPDCVPAAVGTGAGTADPEAHPNVLRVVVGDAFGRRRLGRPRGCTGWTATIDDLDPRLWPEVLEALRSAGAADAWCSPALMRKGRPGQVLSVLVDPERLDTVCPRDLRTDHDARGADLHGRAALAAPRPRRGPAGGVTVGVKRGMLGGRAVTVQPEYDEALAAARAAGRPVHEVLAEVRAAAGGAPPGRPRDRSTRRPAGRMSAVPARRPAVRFRRRRRQSLSGSALDTGTGGGPPLVARRHRGNKLGGRWCAGPRDGLQRRTRGPSAAASPLPWLVPRRAGVSTW